MWVDSRGDKYYDVIPSGDQHFAVRTTDGAGRVLRYTKNLIRRDTVTGAFLWQGAHRTFELDTSGMPTRLVWRCRAGGRNSTWTPTVPLKERDWPHPLREYIRVREEHRVADKQEAAPKTARRWPASTVGSLRSSMALRDSSRRIQERADARLRCASSPALEWLEAGKRLREERGRAQASASGHGAVLTYVDFC